MTRSRSRLTLLLLTFVTIATSGLFAAAPQYVPIAAPIAELLAPQAAQAQITSTGGNFDSDVPCLESPDQFATSCYANTLVTDTSPSGSQLRPVSLTDTALVRFNSSGKTPLAQLAQIGSVYGIAYDDGSASGVRRLLLGAYTRRLTDFGPGGPGAVYAYNLSTGAVSVFTTVPGTVDHHSASVGLDDQVAPWVGASSLGDLEIGPTGTTLYAMNMETRQVNRYSLVSGSAFASISINFAALSSDPAAQANMRPMGLEFQPLINGVSNNLLYVGIVDSGERSSLVVPTAYVIAINVLTGVQTTVLTQPLDAAAIAPRFNDSVTPGVAWRPWRAMGRNVVYPMPLVSDIQFSRDGQTMLVGLRDRNGDAYINPGESTPESENWWRVQEQGDVLVYDAVNGAWQMQTRGSITTPSDFFRDNIIGNTSAPHSENMMGALALTYTGAGNALTEQIVATAITPFVGGTSGANWYNLNPDAYDRQAAVELIPQGDIWKSATLGDLENLCSSAFIGDRVWSDTNGNGVQDNGEAGIGNVVVRLLDVNNSVVGSATTNGSGIYQFAVKPNVAYTLDLATSNFSAGGPLFQKFMSPQNRGGSDTADSDADEISRRIVVAGQGRDAYNMSFDFGLVTDTRLANGEIGDFVWNDLNSNGVQNSGEPGVANVTVRLINTATGVVENIVTTGTSGDYYFRDIVPGTYLVEFVPPSGINASPRDAGGDDARDSDANAASGWRTPAVTIVADTFNYTLDLGLIMGANVRVVKTGPASAPVGTQVSYTITYVNDGPAQADNVVVRDTWTSGLSYVSANPAPAGLVGSTLTWIVGSMAPGAQGTITVVFNVDANAPASGTNQAQITTTTVNNPPGDDTSTVTTQFPRPNVWTQKTGPTTATVGDQFSYTLAYGNNGGSNANNVTLLDTLPVGLSFVSANPAPSSVSGQNVTWNIGTLTSGQQGSISVVVQSTTAATNGTVVVNTAQISTPTPGDNPGDNTSTTSTTLQRADVRVTKSSPTTFPVVSGQQVTYYLDYANAGPAAAVGVTLVDSVPAQITGVAWSCTSGCSTSGTGNSISINLGTLAAGATGRITVTGTAQTSTNREDFTNTATISTTTPETDTTNNQSSVPGAVWTNDVQIIKLAQAQVTAGDTLNATLSYRNNGPAPAMNISVVDTLPTGITFVSASPAPSSISGQTLTWNIGTLADAQSGQITLVLQSDANTANNTTVVNQSQISIPTSDRDTTNNRSDAPTLIVTRSDLSVVKTAPSRVSAGDAVQYTLSYRNNGPSVARSVTLTDQLPAELDYLSANPTPASSVNGLLTWNLGDMQPNQSGIITVQMRSRADQTVPTLTVANTLQISSPTEDPTPDNNTSTVTTDVETADVSVIKRSPAYIVAGLPFTIVLDYANAGPATAQGVTLRDLLPSGLTVVSSTPPATGPGLRWNLGNLASGATGSISVVLRAATTAISGTTYTNVAVIDSPTTIDRDPSNDTSSTISVVRPNADLEIIKTGPTSPVASGSQVVYTLAYRNIGPSDAQNVSIADTLPAGFTFGSANPAPTTNANGTLSWNIGTLASGAAGTITVSGSLMGDGITTTRTNVATISSPTTPDPTPGNNTSTVTTTVLKPDLRVTKTDNVVEVEPGDTLTYVITVENIGATTASGVLLRETPPAGAVVTSSQWAAQNDGTYTLQIGTLAAGASTTASFSMVLPNPLPAGMTTVRNTVVVSDDGSKGDDPTPSNNTSTDTDQTLTGRIGDTVWYDKNGDAQQDTGEAGFGGITLQLIDPASDKVIATTVSDQNGLYMFSGLRMGTYRVTLASETTQIGNLRGYRYTTTATPSGTITLSTPQDMSLDIGLNNPGSTDVVLAYVRAERGADGVVTMKWRTLDEINTLRFRVMRSTTNLQGAVEVGLVQSKGSAGGVYAVTDTEAPSSARYWLIEAERGGKTTTYGPFQQQEPTVTQEISNGTGTTTGSGSVKLFLPLIGR